MAKKKAAKKSTVKKTRSKISASKMTKEDLEYLVGKIENEGFEYCFRHYSSFDDIKDSQFHKLREAFCEAGTKLEDYIEKMKTKLGVDW